MTFHGRQPYMEVFRYYKSWYQQVKVSGSEDRMAKDEQSLPRRKMTAMAVYGTEELILVLFIFMRNVKIWDHLSKPDKHR